MMIGFWDAIKNIGLFFKGATDYKGKAYQLLEAETRMEMDNFLFVCYSDQLGIPLPINYYTLELLPYLLDEMDKWTDRMDGRKSVWEERGTKFGTDF